MEYKYNLKCSKQFSQDCDKIIYTNSCANSKNRICFPCQKFKRRLYTRKWKKNENNSQGENPKQEK